MSSGLEGTDDKTKVLAECFESGVQSVLCRRVAAAKSVPTQCRHDPLTVLDRLETVVGGIVGWVRRLQPDPVVELGLPHCRVVFEGGW